MFYHSALRALVHEEYFAICDMPRMNIYITHTLVCVLPIQKLSSLFVGCTALWYPFYPFQIDHETPLTEIYRIEYSFILLHFVAAFVSCVVLVLCIYVRWVDDVLLG